MVFVFFLVFFFGRLFGGGEYKAADGHDGDSGDGGGDDNGDGFGWRLGPGTRPPFPENRNASKALRDSTYWTTPAVLLKRQPPHTGHATLRAADPSAHLLAPNPRRRCELGRAAASRTRVFPIRRKFPPFPAVNFVSWV